MERKVMSTEKWSLDVSKRIQILSNAVVGLDVNDIRCVCQM